MSETAPPASHYWIFVPAYPVVAAAGVRFAPRPRGPEAGILSRGLE